MGQTNDASPDSIRRYLLGASAPAEQEGIERRLLTDRAFYDEVSAGEDELLDEYLCGQLSTSERASFESTFLAAPERQQKLSFARALRRRIDEAAPPLPADSATTHGVAPARAPGFFNSFNRPARLGFAAVVLLAAAGAILLAVRSSWQSPTPANAPAAAAADRAADVSRPDESPAPPVPTTQPNDRKNSRPKTLAVTLRPGRTRGGQDETKRVVLQAGTELVRLELLIASAEHASYNASVQTVERREVASLTNLPAASVGGEPAVVAELPASTFAPGDYRVNLSGRDEGGEVEPLQTYYFRVTKP